jgi:integrase
LDTQADDEPAAVTGRKGQVIAQRGPSAPIPNHGQAKDAGDPKRPPAARNAARASISSGYNCGALPWQELPALYARLGESDGLSALALRLIILTGCRSGEIRGLRWSEVDFDAKVITIPAARMKRETEFPVPITSQMLAILKPLHKTRDENDLVFPGPRPNKPLANQAAWTMIKRAADGKDITTHGCRSSLRSWCADHGVEFAVAEAMLGHAPGNAVVNAYQRSSMVELRRPVLERWCRFVSGESKVVAIGSRKGGSR